MIRKHFHDHQENVYCCAFNHFFAQNILFLTKVIFIKELSKIFKDYGGKFEDIMLFQGLFKVTRPSFLGGYHPTLELSGIPTFSFIVSLTHRMDNI